MVLGSKQGYEFACCFSERRSTEHRPDSQVRTPSFGRTQSCNTTQIPRKPNPQRMLCVIVMLREVFCDHRPPSLPCVQHQREPAESEDNMGRYLPFGRCGPVL